jgi:hypothetical protein
MLVVLIVALAFIIFPNTILAEPPQTESPYSGAHSGSSGGSGSYSGSSGGSGSGYSLGTVTISNIHTNASGALVGTMSNNAHVGLNAGQYSTHSVYSAAAGGFVSQQNPYDGGQGGGPNEGQSYCDPFYAPFRGSSNDGPPCPTTVIPPRPPTTPGGLNRSCSANGRQVTLRWNASTGGYPPPITYDVAIKRVGDTHFSRNGLSVRTVTAGITPGLNYNWYVRGCASGRCSSWKKGPLISCPPPRPTATLRANPTTVDYKDSSTLTWDSTNATSCAASGDWAGSRSLRGTTDTGPLASTTTYYLQCSHPQGGDSRRVSATVNVILPTGADTDVRCGNASGDNLTVRAGTQCRVTWDVGTSDPANCILSAGAVVLDSSLTEATGEQDWTVPNGETEVRLSCDDGVNSSSSNVKVLPEFQET